MGDPMEQGAYAQFQVRWLCPSVQMGIASYRQRVGLVGLFIQAGEEEEGIENQREINRGIPTPHFGMGESSKAIKYTLNR